MVNTGCITSGASCIDIVLTRGWIFIQVEYIDCWISPDLQSLLQGSILLAVLLRDLLTPGEIYFQKDNILLGPGFEFGFGKDICIQSYTPSAPVTSRKVGQNGLPFFCRDGVRFIKIYQPAGFCCSISNRLCSGCCCCSIISPVNV